MIEKTKQVRHNILRDSYNFRPSATTQEVESEYNVANGHAHNAEVIYGDTDSVMVKFGPTDLVKVMTLGKLYRISAGTTLSQRYAVCRNRGSRFCFR